VLRAAAILALAALAAPVPAWAHGVESQVEDRGGTIAVRARTHGEPLAGAAYQVFSPAAPQRIRAEGRTGPDGWVELVPDAPGTWRVRIVDATGHGAEIPVEVAPARVAMNAAPPPEDDRAGAAARHGASDAPPPRTLLRTLAAAAGLLLAFAGVWAVHRRRRAPGR
jgi:nickel transport protein